MTPLDYALAYATLGLHVVPIPTGCKYPKGINNWEKLATTDPARIRRYWTSHPAHGVGIATGPASGVFVVDIDPRDGGDDSLKALETKYGPLPETVETLTGGGGRHLYFQWPETGEIHNSASGVLGVGIDVRGVDGQVLAPPTIHPTTGTPYVFEIVHDLLDGHRIEVAPDWLVALLQAPPTNNEPRRERLPRLGDLPGDIWAASTTWAEQLERYGATLHSHHADAGGSGYEMWTRPGKHKDRGASASLYYKGSDVLKVFTPNWPGLTNGETYTLWGYHVTLEHAGDYNQAAKDHGKEQRAETAPPSEGSGQPMDTPHGQTMDKPLLFTGGRYLNDISDELVQLMVAANIPPHLFRHGDVVSQLTGEELCALDRVRMLNVVELTVRPVSLKKDEIVPSRIEPAALDVAMLRLLQELPIVQAVMRAPFLRADGSVCSHIGYDQPSGNYLASTVHTNVPTQPTPDDVAQAVALVDDLLFDFPLHTQSDRAHIYALLLTPLVRHLIPLAPLFILDGNGPGVGKNLLAESCMYVTTGQWIQTDPLPLDAEEQRKQITALLSTGRSVALFDEAHIVSGTSLSRLITSTTWGDRLLGYSKQVAYPNRITVVALGNNVEVQGDMPRRSILIRLESQIARPYDRQDFRHADLRHWVEQNRPRLLGALLTLLVAWHQAGRPGSAVRLGSFDAWAAVVGGTLANAGVDGFLANSDAMRRRGATDDAEMEQHLSELWEQWQASPFSTKQVAKMIEFDRLETTPPRMPNDRTRVAQALGHIYRRYSGRWLGTIRVVEDGLTDGARRWLLEQLKATNE